MAMNKVSLSKWYSYNANCICFCLWFVAVISIWITTIPNLAAQTNNDNNKNHVVCPRAWKVIVHPKWHPSQSHVPPAGLTERLGMTWQGGMLCKPTHIFRGPGWLLNAWDLGCGYLPEHLSIFTHEEAHVPHSMRDEFWTSVAPKRYNINVHGILMVVSVKTQVHHLSALYHYHLQDLVSSNRSNMDLKNLLRWLLASQRGNCMADSCVKEVILKKTNSFWMTRFMQVTSEVALWQLKFY